MRRLADEQSGAVAVYVAILLTVLIGMAAFIVDMGDVMWERRMLQNSADAAALAVAIDCAQGDCLDFVTTANTYADENNRRGAFVESVTGPDGGPPTFGGGEVTVVTRTGTTEAPGRLRQFFSGILGREQGLQTAARAKAIWGTPTEAAASPLTVSICAWNRMTKGYSDDGQPFSFPPDEGDLENLPSIQDVRTEMAEGDFGEVIFYVDSQGTGPDAGDACNAPPGFYTDPDAEDEKLPAAFGWLDSDSCEVPITTDTEGNQWGPVKPGAAAGGETDCIKAVRLIEPDPVTVLPIFVGVNEGNVGRPDEYQIVAPAGFYLTGFRLPGGGNPTTWAIDGSPNPCSAPATCVRGFFIKKSEIEQPTDEPTFGLVSIRLAE